MRVILILVILETTNVKVTTKGQVTIPQEIRNRLGIRPGSEVTFTIDGDGARLRPAEGEASPGRRLVDHMRGFCASTMTTDEVLALTRGDS